LKIGLITYGFSSWGGGIDFIRYIASSVSLVKEQKNSDNFLILPGDDFMFYVRKYLSPVKQFIKDVAKGRKPVWRAWNGFDEAYFKNTFSDISSSYRFIFAGSSLNSQIAASMTAELDVILPCSRPAPKDFMLPWVGYMADFQHCYLKELFSAEELAARDRDFQNMLHQAGHIIVNAKAVIDDANRFFGEFPAKVHALPFSPSPQVAWLESTLDVREEYKIEKPYFMVCNQFWKHKDHVTAFRGFSEFIRQGGNALLVCTGATHDYRFPGYFNELKVLVSNLGMQDHIKILGHIPKSDQISLIKNALAMVQTTLFEGGPGGGAAYDAIGLGVPVIASDIPVNLEMDCGDVTFFTAGDPLQLAQTLKRRGTAPRTRPSNEQLLEDGIRRKRRCGQFILDVAAQAITDFKETSHD